MCQVVSLEATFCDTECDTGGLSRVIANVTYRVSIHSVPGLSRVFLGRKQVPRALFAPFARKLC